MAWRSSGTSNAELVANLCRNGMIKTDTVKEAFLKVDRAHYAPSSAYMDSPQAIGYGATISAPHMHATAAEHLLNIMRPPASAGRPSSQARPTRVLDIGSGSGYLTHLLAELLPADAPSDTSPAVDGKAPASVVGLEHIQELRDMGQRNMSKSEEGRALLASGRVRFRVGDGRKGWVEPGEEEAGWDVIHVGASAVEVHDELVQQLRSPGRMFIPVDDEDGNGGQHIWAVDKDAQGVVTKKRLFGVRYVPLTDAPKS